MRTLLRAQWVVAFDGTRHRLLQRGVVVVEGDQIVHVGNSYPGHTDAEYNFDNHVLIPGLIDTHVHIGTRASHRVISDSGTDAFFGQPFLHWAITRPGVPSPGGDGVPLGGETNDLACRFTVAELLRSGVTTFLEVGARVDLLATMVTAVQDLGIRAYLGPGVVSARYVGAEGMQWSRQFDPEREAILLQQAEQFAAKFGGAAEGLINTVVVARELENCRAPLLQRLYRMAVDWGAPLVSHAAYSPIEWQCIAQEHGVSPIEYMNRSGALGEYTIVQHGNLVAETNPHWPGGQDLRLIGDSGASVSHSPINLLRRGRVLDSLQRYLEAGINVCLGADTYPRDLFMQMRAAAYMCKAMTGDFRAGSAADVFNAATLGGADALHRPDLGRICPGAKADIVSVSLRPQSFRMGVVRDPISAIVDCAVMDDVRFVMVAGRVRVENGVVLGIDAEEILDAAQEDADRYWSTVAEWHPSGEPLDEIAPLSFDLI